MNNFEYNKGIAASESLLTIEAILAYSIGNYYNWQTGEPARPSEDTLAKDCKMSVRSVRRALSGLVNKGYMTYTRQYNKPNLYTPVLPMRTVSPFNEDTHGLLKDNRKDNEKIIKNNKSSKEDLYYNLNNNPEEVSLDTDSNITWINKGLEASHSAPWTTFNEEELEENRERNYRLNREATRNSGGTIRYDGRPVPDLQKLQDIASRTEPTRIG